MALHMVKLCVGAEDVDDLANWQKRVVARRKAEHLAPFPVHETRMRPKRADELTAGGSIYWVIKGVVLVRQEIIAVETETDRFGKPYCELVLDPKLVLTEPMPKRPFQGWRYLKPEDAPADLRSGTGQKANLPPKLTSALKEAGVW